MTQAALAAAGITVRYAGLVALSDVAIDLHPGTIHALVGENGAGKSTLMRVLAGARAPDAGTLAMHGHAAHFRTPRDAHRAGIRMIQQELSLVPAFTAAENIVLGDEPSRWGVLDRRATRVRAERAIDGLGASIDLNTPVERLSLAHRQVVEIAKALAADAPSGLRVLILDEPTAILSAHETEALHARLVTLRSRGLAILYCSHRLDEIDRLADHVTVLRDGARVGGGAIREYPPSVLVPLMVGRAIERRSWRAPTDAVPGPVVLTVDKLATVKPPARGRRDGSRLTHAPLAGSTDVLEASFVLRAGEIVGLVGLVGAGRSEVALALFGAMAHTAGTVTLQGMPFRPRSPRDAVRAGIGFVPEDRAASALMPRDSVRVNTTLAALRSLARGGVINRARERAMTRQWVDTLRIRTPSIETPVGRLSGGNQQKVVLARWLVAGDPALSVLIVDEPTRGVDVGARMEIYDTLRQLATLHTSVLVITSDLVEAIALCDRLLVMREGRIVGELMGAAQTLERVAALMVPT
jgi:ABC-type sugar transport system ATPase subunit